MNVVVKDANILIDFANGSLFEHWFRLGYETWTTDLVLSQVQYEHQWREVEPYVRPGALNVRQITREMLTEILSEPWQRRVGPEDASAVYLARELNGVLLTGDRLLRKQGDLLRIEVHGVLWVLDKFVTLDILSRGHAAQKLQMIQEQGSILPSIECEKLLKKWKDKL